jgi:hypothetical protein
MTINTSLAAYAFAGSVTGAAITSKIFKYNFGTLLVVSAVAGSTAYVTVDPINTRHHFATGLGAFLGVIIAGSIVFLA